MATALAWGKLATQSPATGKPVAYHLTGTLGCCAGGVRPRRYVPIDVRLAAHHNRAMEDNEGCEELAPRAV